MFNTLSDRITKSFKNLRSKGRLSASDVEETVSQIRRALLDADVALPVVRSFTAAVREKATGAIASQALNPSQQVVKIVNDELVEILGGQTRELDLSGRPAVIMLAGLQGAGKTTPGGQARAVAEGRAQPQGAPGRLRPPAPQRRHPAAGRRIPGRGGRVGARARQRRRRPRRGCPVGAGQGRGIRVDVVVVDTAGRLGIDEEMMRQAADIRAAVDPNEVLFVIDAMIGQDAVATANAFQEGVGFTGVVVSKLDGDTRGGAALSVRGVTGVPILFASTGEKLADFEQFHADRMASRILDMGDILTLIEQAERTWSEQQQAELAAKMSEGSFTLDDFIEQLQQIKRMGSMKKIMGMLPGMGQYREALEQFDEGSITRIEAIVRSMTPGERNDPKILNGSRRMRIAKGSGTSVQEVNSLMDRFEQARKMMQQVSRGGSVPGMPGIPGTGGGRKAKRAQKKTAGGRANKKGRSGNPAKRAKQEAEAAAGKQQQAAKGSSFGAAAEPPSAADFEQFSKFLR